MAEIVDVVVIGGGQAGLAVSHELTGAGIDHVVLERKRIAQTWRDRWDSFTLVLPNWSLQLPGYPYDGDDPDGFMPRDDLVAYLESYAASFDAPVREGVEVTDLHPTRSGWAIGTSDGHLDTRAVIVATGSFQQSFRPYGWDMRPAGLHEVDVAGYRNPDALPAGKVLVVGSGQSGCQIAEDLLGAGREVFLACGRSPWFPRRIGDHDMYWWATESGFMDMPLAALPDPAQRLAANPQLTGRDGGHDLNLRTLHHSGVTVLGRFEGFDGTEARFAPDLGASVEAGDEIYRQFRNVVRELADSRGIPAVDLMPEPPPWNVEAPSRLDMTGFGAAVLAGGFRPNYGWMGMPEAFDGLGFPIQDPEGVAVLPGLHFVGVHFLRKRKSALLPGVGEDAAVIARKVDETLGR